MSSMRTTLQTVPETLPADHITSNAKVCNRLIINTYFSSISSELIALVYVSFSGKDAG